MNRLIVFAAGLLVTLVGVGAWGAPIQTMTFPQKIIVNVKRVKGTANVVPGGVQAAVAAGSLHWEYIAESSVSVPFITLLLKNVEKVAGATVLVGQSGKIEPEPGKGFSLRLPLIRKDNDLTFTVISPEGQLEQWDVKINVVLIASAVYVDENCRDYAIKIREVIRPSGPNLIYVGCKPGTGPREVSLEVIWPDVLHIEYQGNKLQGGGTLIEVPLDSKRTRQTQLLGVHGDGKKSQYILEYEPIVPPPYEIWAGLAFFRSTFTQSNFPAAYSQIGSAFLGQLWYRPEASRLSFLVRGFGTLYSFSNKLEPDQGYPEASQTYFLDGELRYKVYENKGWMIEPLVGGWLFFMNVESRGFGIQRIIDPIIGVHVRKDVFKRDHATFTLRFVPLQSFFNPADFSFNQAYVEYALSYVHPFRTRNRLFVSLYYGTLKTAESEVFARTIGNYMVLGGGIGW